MMNFPSVPHIQNNFTLSFLVCSTTRSEKYLKKKTLTTTNETKQTNEILLNFVFSRRIKN